MKSLETKNSIKKISLRVEFLKVTIFGWIYIKFRLVFCLPAELNNRENFYLLLGTPVEINKIILDRGIWNFQKGQEEFVLPNISKKLRHKGSVDKINLARQVDHVLYLFAALFYRHDNTMIYTIIIKR